MIVLDQLNIPQEKNINMIFISHHVWKLVIVLDSLHYHNEKP